MREKNTQRWEKKCEDGKITPKTSAQVKSGASHKVFIVMLNVFVGWLLFFLSLELVVSCTLI